MDDETTGKVFEKVKLCMEALVGGSGHLASYSPTRESFQITKAEDLGSGLTRYHFTGQAYYLSEFMVCCDDDDGNGADDFLSGAQTVSGSIVLDNDFGLVRDDEGRVMLEPWKCLDPEKSGR